MKIKLFTLAILLFYGVVFVSSCSKDEKPQTLDVDKTELHFPVGIASRDFNITTTGLWKIEATGLSPYFGPNMGDAEWYKIEPMVETGNARVIVTSKDGTAGNRATLRIKYDGKEKIVELKQDAAPQSE